MAHPGVGAVTAKRRSPLRDRAELWLYRRGRGVAERLRPTTAARAGERLGILFLAVSRLRRRIADFNLRLAFPEMDDAARQRLAKEVARHFGRMLMDTLAESRSPEEILAETEVEGMERVEAVLAEGRGAFFLSAHIGSWEYAAHFTGLRIGGPGLAVVNRPLDNPLLETELAAIRSRFGNRVLGKTRIARGVLEQIRAGGGVGILIDQKPPPDIGIQVPFFGHPAMTHSVLARMVRRTEAPVIPAFGIRTGPGQYKVVYGQTIEPRELSSEELEDVALTARFNRTVEEIIGRHPEQWLWFHDRWRELRCGSTRA